MRSSTAVPAATLLFSYLCYGQTASLGSSGSTTYRPPKASERLKWVALTTLGPASLTAGLVTAGWGTLRDIPTEYGTHWEGFAKRYGMRFTGVGTSNTMEAGLGAIWGEDPRYEPAIGQPMKARIAHIVKMTVLARNRDGRIMPAYARYVGITGSNLLSNAWRPDSRATVGYAMVRSGFGLVGRLMSNAFNEFWPEYKSIVFRTSHRPGP